MYRYQRCARRVKAISGYAKGLKDYATQLIGETDPEKQLSLVSRILYHASQVLWVIDRENEFPTLIYVT